MFEQWTGAAEPGLAQRRGQPELVSPHHPAALSEVTKHGATVLEVLTDPWKKRFENLLPPGKQSMCVPALGHTLAVGLDARQLVALDHHHRSRVVRKHASGQKARHAGSQNDDATRHA